MDQIREIEQEWLKGDISAGLEFASIHLTRTGDVEAGYETLSDVFASDEADEGQLVVAADLFKGNLGTFYVVDNDDSWRAMYVTMDGRFIDEEIDKDLLNCGVTIGQRGAFVLAMSNDRKKIQGIRDIVDLMASISQSSSTAPLDQEILKTKILETYQRDISHPRTYLTASTVTCFKDGSIWYFPNFDHTSGPSRTEQQESTRLPSFFERQSNKEQLEISHQGPFISTTSSEELSDGNYQIPRIFSQILGTDNKGIALSALRNMSGLNHYRIANGYDTTRVSNGESYVNFHIGLNRHALSLALNIDFQNGNFGLARAWKRRTERQIPNYEI